MEQAPFNKKSGAGLVTKESQIRTPHRVIKKSGKDPGGAFCLMRAFTFFQCGLVGELNNKKV